MLICHCTYMYTCEDIGVVVNKLLDSEAEVRLNRYSVESVCVLLCCVFWAYDCCGDRNNRRQSYCFLCKWVTGWNSKRWNHSAPDDLGECCCSVLSCKNDCCWHLALCGLGRRKTPENRPTKWRSQTIASVVMMHVHYKKFVTGRCCCTNVWLQFDPH